MRTRSQLLTVVLIATFVAVGLLPFATMAQTPNGKDSAGPIGSYTTDTKETMEPQSEMRGPIERYTSDRGNLNRSFPVLSSTARRDRFRQFYKDWQASLQTVSFDQLSQDGKVDYLLFKNHLDYEQRQLDIQAAQFAEVEPYLPFAKAITDLEEARRRMEPLDSAKAAQLLTDLKKQVEEQQKSVEAYVRLEARSQPSETNLFPGPRNARITRAIGNRTVGVLNSLKGNLRNWYTFYDGYDPIFTWWDEQPYKELEQSLTSYAAMLNEKVVGLKPADPAAGAAERAAPGGQRGQGGGQGTRPAAVARPGDISDIIGDPIGREALLNELRNEMIPYTPEELIAIAQKEMAWCEDQMKKASRDLGYGDDWHKALEHVKTLYVGPGKQPEMIRDLALEAIKFVDDHDLVTIPQLARDTWRMEMMSPERQLVNPFFLGGEMIQVSYPTNSMTFEQKMMGMRGNNVHFARATVFHELIPGHHLQLYMAARYKTYRNLFDTPFAVEGWALYWELLMWDLNFAKTPENRIGMLFWRMHRCARIVFSLSFHLGKMTPQECVDYLITHVGHEPENAAAEVRRSFNGTYSPLYQAGYLLGGMQLYALRHDLVDSGKLTNRQFHDWILKENSIPIEMVRATLTNQKLTRDFQSSWKFKGPNPLADAPPASGN